MKGSKLIALAKEAARDAYAPYSGFKVGAAVLTTGGRVYTGCNIENSSLGATCCAERVALFKAVSEGERAFDAVAVFCEKAPECVPCGICLQVLAELAPEADIILGSGKAYKLNELLTKAFKLDKTEGDNV